MTTAKPTPDEIAGIIATDRLLLALLDDDTAGFAAATAEAGAHLGHLGLVKRLARQINHDGVSMFGVHAYRRDILQGAIDEWTCAAMELAAASEVTDHGQL